MYKYWAIPNISDVMHKKYSISLKSYIFYKIIPIIYGPIIPPNILYAAR